jgi:hypothetical protein
LDCTHPARREDLRVLDADAVLNCLDFSSTLLISEEVQRSLWPVVRTAMIAIALTLGGMFGMIRLYGALMQPPPPVLLRTSVSTPSVTFQESGFDVKVLVLNEADRPARDVTVFIRGRSMAYLTCQSLEPPDAFVEESPQLTCALIGDLQPGEIGSVGFHFLASQPGELDLVAQVTAANVVGPQKMPIEGEVVP